MMKFTQIGWVTLGILAALVVLLSPGWGAFGHLGAWVLPGVTGLLVLLFGWLTVTIEAEKVRVTFGIGLIRRTWALADVAAVRPVRNSLWTGWGIRTGLGYTLYNVSGRDAVELKFRDGSWRVRIGTNQPAALAEAIGSHLPRP